LRNSRPRKRLHCEADEAVLHARGMAAWFARACLIHRTGKGFLEWGFGVE